VTVSARDNVRYLGQFGEYMLTESVTARDPEWNLGRPSRSAKTYTSHCSRVTAALTAWFYTTKTQSGHQPRWP